MRVVRHVFAGMLCAATALARADGAPKGTARPPLESNRWEEDWSALADPALRTRPLDDLKYLPLSADSPARYLSLGVTLRERFESNDAASFAVAGRPADSYVLQRLQVHADLHFSEHWRLYTELEDARDFSKATTGPADANKADLRLAFVETVDKLGGGTLKARVGRQDFAFDLQRFVSSRDGPNVRQSFDAVWADWERGPWRLIGFVSRPVQYANDHSFDDRSNDDFRFDTVRVERHLAAKIDLSAYWSRYARSDAQYLDGGGTERRQVFDVRLTGAKGPLDWDIESMLQGGRVGARRIRAWAFGPRAGYTVREWPWTPRLGLQFDAASGDTKAGDATLGTFNPLFPNGSYFTLAGYTGYANVLHVKPTVTLHPTQRVSVLAALGLQWRTTEADAVYVKPNVPVPGTAGRPGRWTGAYEQLRADYRMSEQWSSAIEAVHYGVGDVIRHAGGHDSDYVGVELKYLW